MMSRDFISEWTLAVCLLVTVVYGNIEAPVLQPLIIPPALKIGDGLNVFCGIIRGSLPVVFKWYKDGEELESTGNRKISTTEGTSLLKTTQIAAEDIGNYTCSVSNQAGTDSLTSALAFNVSPQWKHTPLDQAAAVGTRLEVQCSAFGFPKPRMTWKQITEPSSMSIPIHSGGSRKFASYNGSLVIKVLHATDSGNYICEARNGLDLGLSKQIKLDVHVPPQLRPTVPVTAKKGGLAQLVCDFNGNGTISVIWNRDDISTPLLNDNRFESTQRKIEGGVQGELLIRGVTKEDQGSYTCHGQSTFGKDNGNIQLKVVESAATPRGVRVLDTVTRSTRVAWRRASTKDDLLKHFIVRYWQRGGNTKRLHDMTLPASETSASLNDLRPGTTYVVQIVAENDVGLSEPTDAFEFQTLEEAPSAPPTDFQIEEVGSSYIALSWKPPPRQYWNGELQGFYLGHKIQDANVPYTFKRVSVSEETYLGKETFSISGLQKSEIYSVVVKAFNSVGPGPPTSEIEIKLPAEDPPLPPRLSLSDVDPSTAVLKWDLERSDPQLKHYELQVRSIGQHKWKTYHVPGKLSFFTLYNLESGQRYEVRIAGVSEIGRGHFSPCFYFNTVSEIHAFEKELLNDPDPFYLRPYVIIPVAASAVVVFTSIIMALVCYKKTVVENKHLKSILTEPLNNGALLNRDQRMSNVSDQPFSAHSSMVVYPRSDGSTYDIPWDGNRSKGTMPQTSSYTRLKPNKSPPDQK